MPDEDVSHQLIAASTGRWSLPLAASTHELSGFTPLTRIWSIRTTGKDVGQVTTKFLVMNAGRLVFEGTETELQASKDPYVRKFVREGGA